MVNNIFWVICDSVRSYSGNLDERYRLKVFDEIKDDFYNFENAYTSAPSSIMSASAMFTGQSAYSISKNFSDWTYSKNVISIHQLLKKNNYNIWTIDNSKRGREMMKDIFFPLEKKYFIKGIKHANNWTNQEINNQIIHLLENTIKKSEKNFITLWYDCRGDDLLSDKIKILLENIKKNDLYKDSMIIITSDHGYPDPKFVLKESILNKRHDLIMTEDNIKVPLLIKFPQSENIRNISAKVCLTSIPATIIDTIGISPSPFKQSLYGLCLHNKKFNEFIRIDNRLNMQKGRITVIIKDSYKLYYYHDNNSYNLYNIDEDPKELNSINISAQQNESVLEKFNLLKNFFKTNEKIIINNHYNNSKENLKKFNFDKILLNVKNVAIFSDFEKDYILLLIDSILKKNSDIKINFFSKKKYEFDGEGINYSKINNVGTLKLELKQKFDLTIVFDEKNFFYYKDNDYHSLSSYSTRDKKIFIDSNFQIYEKFLAKWLWPLRKYKNNWTFYKDEPSLIAKDLIKLFLLATNNYLFKKKVDNPDLENFKIARDQHYKTSIENKELRKRKFENKDINYLIGLPHLSTVGGTQKEVVNLSRKLNKNFNTGIFFTHITRKKNHIIDNYPLHQDIKILEIKKIKRKYNIIQKFLYIFLVATAFILLKIRFPLLKELSKLLNVAVYFRTNNIRPKNIVSFLTSSNLLFCALKKFKVIKGFLIINERNDFLQRSSRTHIMLSNYLYRYADKIITNSYNTYIFFKKKKANIHLSYNKNFIENFEVNVEENFNSKTIINVARLVGQKNQLNLIKDLNKNNFLNEKNFKLDIIGEGSLEYKINDYISKYNLKHKVNIKYFNPHETKFIYKNVFAFILPSHFEGQSNSFLEAISAGIPIIIKKKLKDEYKLLYNNDLDFIFDYESSFELKDNLLKLLKDKKKYLEISKKNLEFKNILESHKYKSTYDIILSDINESKLDSI